MRVRLQMGQATPVRKDRPKNQRLAAAAGALLTPFTVLAALLAVWQIAADMKVASAFLFESGALSHWTVWGAVALALGWMAHWLNRYGRQGVEDESEEGAASGRGAR